MMQDATLDIQQKYLNRFQDLQTDLENKANENARLRYDFQFLKSEYSHAKEDFERKLYEQQQHYKSSLEALATERQELIIAKDANLTKSKKELSKISSEVEFNLKRISDQQEEINVLVRDKNQILEDYQNCQRQYKHNESSRNEEIRKLNLNNQSLESQLQQTKQELDKVRSNLLINQEKVASEIRRSDDYESELRKVRNELSTVNRDLEKTTNREKQHKDEMEKSFLEKIKTMECLLEAANAQRNEQRRLASEIEVKSNKEIEKIRNKLQIELNNLTSERDGLISDNKLQADKIEILEQEKKEERKTYENQLNELNEEVASYAAEVDKLTELNKSFKLKVENVTELEQQLHASKIQIKEITEIYETFKTNALDREKQLTEDKNTANNEKIDAIKELSNERADISRNLDIIKDENNRKNLNMLKEKHELENKLNDKDKDLKNLNDKNVSMKKREAKIKKSVTNKFDSYGFGGNLLATLGLFFGDFELLKQPPNLPQIPNPLSETSHQEIRANYRRISSRDRPTQKTQRSTTRRLPAFRRKIPHSQSPRRRLTTRVTPGRDQTADTQTTIPITQFSQSNSHR